MEVNEYIKDLYFRYGIYNDVRYRKNEKNKFIETIKKRTISYGF